MSRILSWFSTKNGKFFTRICVGVSAVAVFGNHISIQGPMLDNIIEIFQVHRYGKPRALPDNVNILVQEVLRDCTLKEEEKKKLKFFYMIGHEISHFGGITSPWGAAIGIPFTFEDMQNIDFGELRLRGRETVEWIIEGQDLINALNLSDSAKKFALMREIYSCNFSDILENAAIAGMCVLIPARVAQVYNTRVKAFEKLTLRQRSLRYFALYACGFILYRLMKDPLKHLSETKADKLAAQTSSEYLSGGIEYYTKTLMKNKALEDVSKSKLWRQYDDHGNPKYFLLAPKLPISKRLDNLKDMMRSGS